MPKKKKVAEIMSQRFFTVPETHTIKQVAQRLAELKVGAIAVTDIRGQIIGMFSERDLVNRVVSMGIDPQETPVTKVMSCPIISISPDATIHEAFVKMNDHHIRHLPVMDEIGNPLGMLGIRDLLQALLQVAIDEIFEDDDGSGSKVA